MGALVGLMANPDFSLGADATSVQVFGVDFNGWHAVSGFLVWGPGLIAYRRDELAVPYVWAVIIVLLITSVWTQFSERPAWVFYFPHPTGDTILHVGSAVILALLLLLRQRDRVSVTE